jgi:hypothetical protein
MAIIGKDIAAYPHCFVFMGNPKNLQFGGILLMMGPYIGQHYWLIYIEGIYRT